MASLKTLIVSGASTFVGKLKASTGQIDTLTVETINGIAYGTATADTNGLMSSADKSKLDDFEVATISEVSTYLEL